MQSPSGEQILSIRTEEVEDVTGLPVIVSNVTIFSDLTFKAQSRGALVPYKNTAHLTTLKSKLSTVAETLNILASLMNLGSSTEDDAAAAAAASMLDRLAQHQTSNVAPVAAFFGHLRSSCSVTISVIFGNCQEVTTGFQFGSSSRTKPSSGSKV